MDRCPSCGQLIRQLPNILTADHLIQVLSAAGGDGRTRDVYFGNDGSGYYVTYGQHERVAKEAIDEALSRGLIALTYPNCADSWSLPAKSAENHQKARDWETLHAISNDRTSSSCTRSAE